MPPGSPGAATNAALIEIYELTGRYADAVMRRDTDAWLACWSTMPRWHLDGQEVRGREALEARWTETLERYPLVIHKTHPGPLVLRGGRARGRCTVEEILRDGDGNARQVIGVYHDEFENEDRWAFSKRRFDVLLTRPIDLGDAETRAWPEGLEDFLDI
ncbi:MAG TPA: nuclear transport factor 2 family protein [Pseudomonadales bacterium]|nr:nuclear transport factor 2 family protein [Pseudomonadales bacterium]